MHYFYISRSQNHHRRSKTVGKLHSMRLLSTASDHRQCSNFSIIITMIAGTNVAVSTVIVGHHRSHRDHHRQHQPWCGLLEIFWEAGWSEGRSANIDERQRDNVLTPLSLSLLLRPSLSKKVPKSVKGSTQLILQSKNNAMPLSRVVAVAIKAIKNYHTKFDYR